MNIKFDKVMFFVWLVFVLWALALFVLSIAIGEGEILNLTIAFCGVVICQLYWRLWHRPVVEKTKYVIINFDTGRILSDSMFDAVDFSKALDRYYEHKMTHNMPIVDAAPSIKIKKDL